APALPTPARRYEGAGLRRIDLPGKLRGEPVFVHDVPDVRHARVVRPGWIGHQLARPADADALVRTVHEAVGIAVDVVVDGSFVAVIADREGDAVLAADEVAAHLQWVEPPAPAGSPADPDPQAASVESSGAVVGGTASEEAAPPPLPHEGAATVASARYSKPFLLHGAIGPSAAVAQSDGDGLLVLTHSQGVELLRPAIAEALDL